MQNVSKTLSFSLYSKKRKHLLCRWMLEIIEAIEIRIGGNCGSEQCGKVSAYYG
ncbi:MAG: hypothetical protein ACLFR1_10570 [Spirochaetia bacterium]